MATVRAFLAERDGDVVTCGVGTLDTSELGTGEVLVRVDWSSVNYKDALATQPKGGVARLDRLVPGIDLAGTVEESRSAAFLPGQQVLAHGYGLGVSHHGGFAAYARVPEAWLLHLPDGLTQREAMIAGTAGFTAALSVVRLLEHGLAPDDGAVLVTGASGGVGSFAVAVLARLGFEVVASTGKEAAREWLGSLGATAVIGREELSGPGKPLEEQRWAAAVDCVGGSTLAGVLRSLRWGGAVAASGLTGGPRLETTVFPFILRAVSLLGIDSVELPLPERAVVWARLATDLRPRDLESIVAEEIGLEGIGGAVAALLAVAVRGRYLVRPAP
jgi:acrylyl-CoA reductase (NADPH)